MFPNDEAGLDKFPNLKTEIVNYIFLKFNFNTKRLNGFINTKLAFFTSMTS